MEMWKGKYEDGPVKMEGKVYTAHFLEGHETLRGIVYEVTEISGSPGESKTVCYILKKGGTRFVIEYRGASKDFEINGTKIQGEIGLPALMRGLEDRELLEGKIVLKQKARRD